jgi:hypothetical protein
MRPITCMLVGTVASCLFLSACSSRLPSRSLSGPVTLVDFLQAYNAYATGQLYLKRGQHAEALVEYKQSLQQFARFDDATRRVLREQYGLTQEQVEREFVIATALAQQEATTASDPVVLEQFRGQVLAGLYPYGHGSLSHGEVQPGTRITRDNWQIAQDLLPQEILTALANDHFSIVVQETTDLPPSDAYVVATLGSGATVSLTPDGELAGYMAGRPFPVLEQTDTQAGLKAAWNLRYHDSGDRIEQWSDTVVFDGQSNKQYSFSSYDARACGMYRAQQQYNIAEWADNGIVCKELSHVFAVPVSGHSGVHAATSNPGEPLLTLRHRPARDHRPIGQWQTSLITHKVITVAYNPEASTFGFPAIQEDFSGGQITTHDWRLIAAKPALVPAFVRDQQALFGGTGGGYPLDPWELRYVYVLENLPRSPHHPYSRQILYVDQQTFVPFYVMSFDAKNMHWRTKFFSFGNPEFYPGNREVGVPILLGRAWIDHRARYATVSSVNKAVYNQELSPELFTLSSLMQRGK